MGKGFDFVVFSIIYEIMSDLTFGLDMEGMFEN
jgi:hypothetical protein